MLTLYHAPQSRSSRIIWLLEELGADYRIETVSIRRRDPAAEGPDAPMFGSRDPANPHPHGKVPAIDHHGVLIYESSAVVLYLTDAFPQNGIGPGIGDPLRGPYLSWLSYYAGVLEPAFVTALFGFTATNSTTAWVPVEDILERINARLTEGPYLLGEDFSGADVLYGSLFALFMGSPLVPRTDVLAAYVKRLTSRPAFRRAAEKDGTVAA